MAKEGLWTITDLSRELGITPRTIRYYEEKGLIRPGRSGGDHRLFDKRERTRLKLILRGKRFGLTLDEISDILGSATADMNEIDQVKKALEHFKKVLSERSARKAEVEKMQTELLQYVGGMMTRLSQLEGNDSGSNY